MAGDEDDIMSTRHWVSAGDIYRRLAAAAAAAAAHLPRRADVGAEAAWLPSTDITETDGEYTIRACLPAVKKEDIHVTLDQGFLMIKGERRQQEETKNEKLHRVESFFGSFERSFALPDNANQDAITAECKDGVLTIHVPKIPRVPENTKQVAVQ
jgi:HSP20 family protein